jgi:hypothetical protein
MLRHFRGEQPKRFMINVCEQTMLLALGDQNFIQ